MIRDQDEIKRLNLLRQSPTFAIRELNASGEGNVLQHPKIPDESGIYSLAGTTILRCGTEVESVSRVNTDSGGTLLEVAWHLDGNWYHSDDPDALEVLGLEREDVSPFDWSYRVPLGACCTLAENADVC